MKLSETTQFLSSKKSYELAKTYWDQLLKRIKPGFEEYIDNRYTNGEVVLDGNPLFSALYPNLRGVRIIQNPISVSKPILSIWDGRIEIEDNYISEIVIFLQPLDYLVEDVFQVIKRHVHNKPIKEFVTDINRKYDIKWNEQRSKRIIRGMNSINILGVASYEDLTLNQDVLHEISKFAHLEEFYVANTSVYRSVPTTIALKNVERQLIELNDYVSINRSYRLLKAPKLSAYKAKLRNVYRSEYSFKLGLASRLTKLRDQTEKLEEVMKDKSHSAHNRK